jgi:hypothetical protein
MNFDTEAPLLFEWTVPISKLGQIHYRNSASYGFIDII